MLRYIFLDLTRSSNSELFHRKIITFLIDHSFHLVLLIRIGCSIRRVPFVGFILSKLLEYLIRILYASDISLKSTIGPGFVIKHGHDIVIGADVKIGFSCTIFNGVTLGNKDLDKPSKGSQPAIGNNVTLCTGSKILGPIKIGNNSLIGANSVVLSDVPDGSVAVGIPSRLL